MDDTGDESLYSPVRMFGGGHGSGRRETVPIETKVHAIAKVQSGECKII